MMLMPTVGKPEDINVLMYRGEIMRHVPWKFRDHKKKNVFTKTIIQIGNFNHPKLGFYYFDSWLDFQGVELSCSFFGPNQCFVSQIVPFFFLATLPNLPWKVKE